MPVRVDLDGELPYDLAAYLNPIQYATWKNGVPPEALCQQLEAAILQQAELPGQARPADQPPDPAGIRRLAETMEARGAPLPVADPRLETGTLDPSSPFYIKRQADAEIESLVRRAGDTVVVKAPRQFGKIPMARAHSLASQAGVASCILDFQYTDKDQRASLDTLCHYLARKLSQSFRTPMKPDEIWSDDLGPKESLTLFLEDGVLRALDKPVLICLDEVDRAFDHDYRDDLFSMLRSWHNLRATNHVWRRLNLLIVHSTTPELWIQDPTHPRSTWESVFTCRRSTKRRSPS